MRVTAILGTYRKGGVIDTAVDEVLAAAREGGATTLKIYLIERHVEFCSNCRTCMQQAGAQRGECCIADDMSDILNDIEQSDGLVLASPMNFGTVTAVMKRFIERLGCFAYWPWGAKGPKARSEAKAKRAVVIASSAMPAIMALLMTGIVGLLKKTAGLLGARTVGMVFIGLAAQQEKQDIGRRARAKARSLGKKLAR
jgi:multimeric flavodoxin WrbA